MGANRVRRKTILEFSVKCMFILQEQVALRSDCETENLFLEGCVVLALAAGGFKTRESCNLLGKIVPC